MIVRISLDNREEQSPNGRSSSFSFVLKTMF